MSRYRLWGSTVLVPAAAVAVFMIGCGGGEKTTTGGGGGVTSGSRSSDSGSARATGERTPIEAKGTATLKGKVTFAGTTMPEPKDLTDQMKANMQDRDHCLKGPTHTEEWIINKGNKAVQNVVVFLRAPAGKYFDVPQNLRTRTDAAVMDQPFCAFTPHVMAINPSDWDAKAKKQVKTGQHFKIQNTAPINHNTACQGGGFTNPLKNIIVPAKKGDKIEALVYDAKPCRDNETGKEDILKINCDIHKWMTARVVVLDHPYYAVTDKDGNYEIKDAPGDADVEVVVWHESMGDSINKAQKHSVKLNTGDNSKDFTVGQ